ncbi:barstar family protein [Nocardia caishijiensis]|uniref:Barstar (Barnase inhibitor) n=1 Tax=Nocardia caishijiensis TaxID=184756 RepID=A0ABQ6YNI6_9NOCA|nr:barstar family protein [Nocardia caishijiensis]KAF0847343.1 barstar (barnase inhibitor) [Nocardia caishijiensis]
MTITGNPRPRARFALRSEDADHPLLAAFDRLDDFFVGDANSGDEFDACAPEGLVPVHFRVDGIRSVGPMLRASVESMRRPADLGDLDLDVLDEAGNTIGRYWVGAVALTDAEDHGPSFSMTGWVSRLPHRSADAAWDRLRRGRLTLAGQWVGLTQAEREGWLEVAMRYERHLPPKPPPCVITVNGGDITDLAGFYCAIGEAANGPGGYFGANFMALRECARDRPGLTVRWRDSDASARHLDTVVETLAGPMTWMELAVSTLRDAGATVVLE